MLYLPQIHIDIYIQAKSSRCNVRMQEVRAENNKLVSMSISLSFKVYLWVFTLQFSFQLKFTSTSSRPLVWRLKKREPALLISFELLPAI